MFCSLRSILPGMLAFCLTCLATPPALHAATRTFPQLPDAAHADTEVSTNVVLSSWNRDTRNFHVVLSLDATPSNNMKDWDLLKVTVRGTDAKHELVTVKFSGDAVVLLVR